MIPGGSLLHPVAVLALVVLLFNDHYWKGTGPPQVTGKLSDVAVMILVPLVFQAAVEWLGVLRGRWAPSRAVLVTGVVLAAGIMASINTWAPAAEAYRWGLAALQWPARSAWGLLAHHRAVPLRPVSLVMDPADLWTIPAAALPLWLGWRRCARSEAREVS